MKERSRELRDRAVWVLARLSLAMLLAMLAALFVGGAAAEAGPARTDDQVVEQTVKPAHEGPLDEANPLGIALIGLVVAGGVGVLLVGAFRPQRHSSSDLAELLRD